ncbi:GtrA family protein [Luteibacter sp. PPL552]
MGIIQLVLDWITFVCLTYAGVPATPSNICGRVLGACAGFWLNGKWTFSHEERSVLSQKAMGRFVASWVLTTVLSTLIVSLVNHDHGLHWAWIAKPVADAVLAALGFAISKYWIYR